MCTIITNCAIYNNQISENSSSAVTSDVQLVTGFSTTNFNKTTTTQLRPFNGLFSMTTWVSQHQKGKPFCILLEQDMMGWQ